MNCVSCKQEIRRGMPYWERVSGWKQRRVAGGTNHIKLAHPTGQVMCEPCMHVAVANVNAGQQTLGET